MCCDRRDDTFNVPPMVFGRWSTADKARLKEMLEFKIKIENTALGRRQEIMKRKLFASIPSMTPAEKSAWRR